MDTEWDTQKGYNKEQWDTKRGTKMDTKMDIQMDT